MTNPSFRSAGSALMIEDNPGRKIQTKTKSYALVALGLKIYCPAQPKMSIYLTDFFAIYMEFLEFPQILWEAKRSTIILTDVKSVTVFFRIQTILPSLWNAYDNVQELDCKIVHITSSINTAAELLSRLEIRVTEKMRLKIQRRHTDNTHRGENLPRISHTKKNSPSHKQMVKVRPRACS